MKRVNYTALIVNILIPVIIGVTAAWFTRPEIEGWYTVLNKPSFTPPNWAFPTVWPILYVCMGVAFYLIWQKRHEINNYPRLMAVYAIQLVLNFLWSFLFFKMHLIGMALVDIILLIISIITCIILYRPVSRAAMWLMVPYLAWVCFATALNLAIFSLN